MTPHLIAKIAFTIALLAWMLSFIPAVSTKWWKALVSTTIGATLAMVTALIWSLP